MAIARTATVRVWVPALPPIDAAMGISTASITICSIVPWNRPITIEATMAVARFHEQPGEPRLAGNDDRVVKIVLLDAAEPHEIFFGLFVNDVDDVVDRDHADQAIRVVDDGR